MKRLATLAALGLTGLLMSVTASAATLPTIASKVGGGSASVGRCDPNGFTTNFTTSGGRITSVTVGDIAAPCFGAPLRVTLTQGNTSVATGGPLTISNIMHTVTVTGAPNAWQVDGFKAVVVGP
jgi:hypothetical protein